jgi:hypothetical protein
LEISPKLTLLCSEVFGVGFRGNSEDCDSTVDDILAVISQVIIKLSNEDKEI